MRKPDCGELDRDHPARGRPPYRDPPFRLPGARRIDLHGALDHCHGEVLLAVSNAVLFYVFGVLGLVKVECMRMRSCDWARLVEFLRLGSVDHHWR